MGCRSDCCMIVHKWCSVEMTGCLRTVVGTTSPLEWTDRSMGCSVESSWIGYTPEVDFDNE